MTYAAKILADSISPDGVRLTTMEVVLPRIVLAELNTHKVLSRNSASSRAIPVKKMLQRVMEHPYIPSYWGKNQKGMQADEEVSEVLARSAEKVWLDARDLAVKQAEDLLHIGIHKQFTNRLLEPFMWHTVIVTATEWSNFEHLRCHHAAHPDIRRPAELMREARRASTPEPIDYDGWHLPFIDEWDYDRAYEDDLATGMAALTKELVKVSCARCARVSHLTHDGKRDLNEDLALHDRLMSFGHMSPFEHAARPMTKDESCGWRLVNGSWAAGRAPEPGEPFCGNFRGWVQYRKLIAHEADILAEQSDR